MIVYNGAYRSFQRDFLKFVIIKKSLSSYIFHLIWNLFFTERPLHYKENVLEQVLRWSSLAEPGSAYLVVKKFLTADTIKHCSGRCHYFTLQL